MTDPNALTLEQLWPRLINDRAVMALIDAAMAEDTAGVGDLTSELTIPPGATATAKLVARQPGRLAGLRLLGLIAKRYDQLLAVTLHSRDSDAVGPGDAVATITGPLRSMLTAERVLLNFICHLSGIATLTDQYVQAIAGTSAGIYDTRKTLPAYRTLAKYAVRCGGGRCHRMGLHDAVLIKDNHLAHVPADDLRAKVLHVVKQAKQCEPRPMFVEVEVDSLEQLGAVIDTGVDLVLLDNMPPDRLAVAVAMRAERGVNIELEASGGVNLDTVRPIAESGVDRIAVGALTHSAPALDLGLDIKR